MAQAQRDVQSGISSIGQSGATSVDSNRDTANQVAHADCETSPEQRVASEVVGAGVELLSIRDRLHLGGEDDGHDDAVDGHDFAEDDRDQVLGSYPGSLDTTTDNGYTSCENAPAMTIEGACIIASGKNVPGRAYNGKTNAQGDAQTGPGVWRYGFEKAPDVKCLALAVEQHVCPSLAIACARVVVARTQAHHRQGGGRTAGTVCENHRREGSWEPRWILGVADGSFLVAGQRWKLQA